MSPCLKFHFAFGIWCLSVILSWVLVQFLQGGGAGVWGVISFIDEVLRCILYFCNIMNCCIYVQNKYIARVPILPLSVSSRHTKLGSNGRNCCTRKFNSKTFTSTHWQHHPIFVAFCTNYFPLHQEHLRKCLMGFWSVRAHHCMLWDHTSATSIFGRQKLINEHLDGHACIWCYTSINSVHSE